MKEDSTVYEYDEVYDDIQKARNQKAAEKEAEKVERKVSNTIYMFRRDMVLLSNNTFFQQPRYIQLLIAAADKRKKENERIIFRRVQKEREAEGDQFADKEVFVTAAYKKKLEEMAAAEEEEKRLERLEGIHVDFVQKITPSRLFSTPKISGKKMKTASQKV